MYRLRVIPLYLPPLRARDGDLSLIAQALIDEHNERQVKGPAGRRVQGFTQEATLALQRYAWPGNIRELRNVIEYALIMGDGEQIELSHLPPELRGEGPVEIGAEPRSSYHAVEAAERGVILNALSSAQGHRGEAAKRLGISRATLWRKMKQHGLLDD